MSKGQQLIGEMKELLLKAAPYHLDPQTELLIRKWDTTPKAIQILEVLDKIIYAALDGTAINSFLFGLLPGMLEVALDEERTTLKALIPLATWRNRD